MQKNNNYLLNNLNINFVNMLSKITILIMYSFFYVLSVIIYDSNPYSLVIMGFLGVFISIFCIIKKIFILDLFMIYIIVTSFTFSFLSIKSFEYQKQLSGYFFYYIFIGTFCALIGMIVGEFSHSNTKCIVLTKYFNIQHKVVKVRNYAYIFTIISIVCYLINININNGLPIFSIDRSKYVLFDSRFYAVTHWLQPTLILVIYSFTYMSNTTKHKLLLSLCFIYYFIAPLLAMNRGGIVFMSIFAFPSIYIYAKKYGKINMLRIIILIFLILFIMLSVKRVNLVSYTVMNKELRVINSQSNYLVSPKVDTTLAFLLTYVTIGYNNFDHNISRIAQHSWGARIIFPFNPFTRLHKFINEVLKKSVAQDISPGLNIHCMIAHVFYDLGQLGVICVLFFWGYCCGVAQSFLFKSTSVVVYILFSMCFLSVVMSFFVALFTLSTFGPWLFTVLIFRYLIYSRIRIY